MLNSVSEINFIIAGAARCGTTYLWSSLQQHNEICLPNKLNEKEPNYFCSSQACSKDDYLKLFSHNNGEKYVGEASSWYMCCDKSPELIFQNNKDTKIIISLRSPAERAYSLFKWMVQNNYEKQYDFSKALNEEDSRRLNFKDHQQYYDFLYKSTGIYSSNLKNYINLFGSNCKIIIFEEWINNFDEIYRDILQWLNLDFQKLSKIPNKNHMSKLRKFKYSKFLPNFISEYFNLNKTLEFKDDVRKELSFFYKQEISVLSKILKKNLHELWG